MISNSKFIDDDILNTPTLVHSPIRLCMDSDNSFSKSVNTVQLPSSFDFLDTSEVPLHDNHEHLFHIETTDPILQSNDQCDVEILSKSATEPVDADVWKFQINYYIISILQCRKI